MRTMDAQEQRRVDREVPARLGISLRDLMQRAAAGVVTACLSLLRDPQQPIWLVCGPGNNGGDGYAAAWMLAARGLSVSVVDCAPGRARSPLAARERARAAAAGLLRAQVPRVFPADCLLVDAVYGAGFSLSRPLAAETAACLADMRRAAQQGATVVAVDLPSGVAADTGQAIAAAVPAAVTVTFVRPKPGLFLYPGRALAGQVITETLSIQPTILDAVVSPAPARFTCVLHDARIRAWALPRPPDAHKGIFGRVLIFGGSPGMGGAVTLAVGAALRSGAGLVHALVAAAARAGIDARHPEALLAASAPFPPSSQELAAQCADKQVVLAGPGLAVGPDERERVAQLVAFPGALVLDAGALTALADASPQLLARLRARADQGLPPVVLTPHPGEYARLAPDLPLTDPIAAARTLAQRCGGVVVLKGGATVVAAPDGRCAINPTGNHGLATGGSGDVLAGLLAGLLAQGMAAWPAACAAVYLHGLAADLAARDLGRRALLPGDLAQYFGAAFRQCGWEEES